MYMFFDTNLRWCARSSELIVKMPLARPVASWASECTRTGARAAPITAAISEAYFGMMDELANEAHGSESAH